MSEPKIKTYMTRICEGEVDIHEVDYPKVRRVELDHDAIKALGEGMRKRGWIMPGATDALLEKGLIEPGETVSIVTLRDAAVTKLADDNS